MNDLFERIKASIGNPNSDLWFPELTVELAARAWECLRRDIGLTPDNYGTARVLSHGISAPRDIIGFLTMYELRGLATATAIEILPPEYTAEYQKKGVSFYSPAEIRTTVRSCIEEALDIINQVSSLMGTVSVLVRSLHLIKPADDYYDVSFSEPHVPFSVFVSVPKKRMPDDTLRVAEAVIHEAMHLQLTLIEEIIPLVKKKQRKYFSPWRSTYRPVQGVLHGLYVFGVINSFLAQLSLLGISSTYVENRRAAISNQILAVQPLQNSPDLTLVGEQLIRRLLDSVNARAHKAPLAS